MPTKLTPSLLYQEADISITPLARVLMTEEATEPNLT